MNLRLDRKNAVVCGSSKGIGKAIAEVLASQGATVTLIARNASALSTVLNGLNREAGQQHGYLTADFSNPDELKSKVERLLPDRSPIHILVNNTGGPPPGPVSEAAPEAFARAFSQHLICNQILTQAMLPAMKEARYGRIINIISTSVKQPIRALGVSNTVRGAVANWSKTLASELGPFGITVNNVLPGATKTGRLDALIEGRAKKLNESTKIIAETMIADIPASRFAEPEEIAYAVAFLASPAAAYINGINLPVDGGRTGCL